VSHVIRPIIFGKYCLLERVSVGGMAEVFRARPFHSPNFGRFLAVKRILPNLAEDDEFVSMFVDEAKIAVQLNHRNVCQIYELGRLGGSYYIVMEYIPGKNLLQVLNRFQQDKRIMSVTQAAWLAARICDGLDYSHRKTGDDGRELRIIHRDVSPQNILVSYEGEVKVIDFGIARAATRNEQTQVGVLKGKFGYMSPEQASGEEVDRRSDIFAVGTLLWEMLTARRLFYGHTDFATLELVRAANVEPPSARNKRVPPEIDAIVMKALARDRDERYAWASEMAADLRTFLDAVKPPYTDRTLAQWMAAHWKDEVEVERTKLVDFERFVTPEDVVAWLDAQVDELEELEEELDDVEDEATRVWQGGTEEGAGEGAGDQPGVPATAGPASDPRASATPEPAGPRPAFEATLDERTPVVHIVSARVALPSTDSPATRLASRRRARNAFGMLFAAVAIVAAIALVWVATQPSAPPTGSLVIDVSPAEGVQVFVNGGELTGVPPHVVEQLKPGTVFVELRKPGFETVVEPVIVQGGVEVRFARTLTPEAQDGRVAITLTDPATQVYLDGALVGGQGITRTFTANAREEHVVEAYLPGHFVETWTFRLDAGGEFAREARMRPVTGAIRVDPEPDGRVSIGGEVVGESGEAGRADLDVRRPWPVTVARPGFQPWEQTVVFDTYYDIRMQPRLRRIGETATDPPTEWGWLTTGVGDSGWLRVLVDGRDTGLITPIDPVDGDVLGLALKAGTRRITFSRAGRDRTVEVMVRPGESVHVEVPPAAPQGGP
jgi:serine/threonine protein kinase